MRPSAAALRAAAAAAAATSRVAAQATRRFKGCGRCAAMGASHHTCDDIPRHHDQRQQRPRLRRKPGQEGRGARAAQTRRARAALRGFAAAAAAAEPEMDMTAAKARVDADLEENFDIEELLDLLDDDAERHSPPYDSQLESRLETWRDQRAGDRMELGFTEHAQRQQQRQQQRRQRQPQWGEGAPEEPREEGGGAHAVGAGRAGAGGASVTGRDSAEAVGFLPFEEARDKARLLASAGANSELLYRRMVSAGAAGTEGLPLHPHRVYRLEGWQYWEDFLGTPGDVGIFLPYEEARERVHQAGIRSQRTFRDLIRARDPRLVGVPINPSTGYAKSGWVSWAQFLPKSVKPMSQAVTLLAPMRLRSKADFEQLSRWGIRPAGVPSNPSAHYMPHVREHGLPGDKHNKNPTEEEFWDALLGVRARALADEGRAELGPPRYLTYLRTRRFLDRWVQPELTCEEDYEQWASHDESRRGAWAGTFRRPESIPEDPMSAYANRGWRGWSDFCAVTDTTRWSVHIARRRLRRRTKVAELLKEGVPMDELPQNLVTTMDLPMFRDELDEAFYEAERARTFSKVAAEEDGADDVDETDVDADLEGADDDEPVIAQAGL